MSAINPEKFVGATDGQITIICSESQAKYIKEVGCIAYDDDYCDTSFCNTNQCMYSADNVNFQIKE